jgi:Uncharacterized conserved protein
MSLHLRISMIVLALGVVITIVRMVNNKHMRMQYSLVWVVLSVMMLIIAIFPVITEWLCTIAGIQTQSNLVYLMGILALLLVSFMQTGIVSKQADQITLLTQELSLHKYREQESQEKEHVNENEK